MIELNKLESMLVNQRRDKFFTKIILHYKGVCQVCNTVVDLSQMKKVWSDEKQQYVFLAIQEKNLKPCLYKEDDTYKLCHKKCHPDPSVVSVVRRVKKHSIRSHVLKKLQELMVKHENVCYYCNIKVQLPVPGVPLRNFHATIDHKIPRSKGGKDTDENLKLACQYCNKNKMAMSEEEFKQTEGFIYRCELIKSVMAIKNGEQDGYFKIISRKESQKSALRISATRTNLFLVTDQEKAFPDIINFCKLVDKHLRQNNLVGNTLFGNIFKPDNNDNYCLTLYAKVANRLRTPKLIFSILYVNGSLQIGADTKWFPAYKNTIEKQEEFLQIFT